MCSDIAVDRHGPRRDDAWQRALREHGVEVAGWQIHLGMGMGGDQLVAHLLDDVAEERSGDARPAALRDAGAAAVYDGPGALAEVLAHDAIPVGLTSPP